MDNTEKIQAATETLSKLEQEKLRLDFFGKGTKAELDRSTAILEQMQPLYELLGGVYITLQNSNYLQPVVLYTLYDHPADIPDHYVIRKHFVTKFGAKPDREIFFKSKELAECELKMSGFAKMLRSPDDSPVIMCTYI